MQKISKVLTIGIILAGITLLVVKYGFNLSEESLNLLHFLTYFFSFGLAFQFLFRFLFSQQKKNFLEENRKELILICFLGIALFFLRTQLLFPNIFSSSKDTAYLFICQIFIVAFIIIKIPYFYKLFSFFHLSPPLNIVFTFLILIAIGTFLLILPFSTVPGNKTSVLNAIFTATSSTCVTGLIVLDTGSHFSIFGQTVILILIQIGGLGLMIFASFFALLSGNFGVKERIMLRDIVRYENLSKMGYLVLSIISLTFVFELIGAIFLYFQFLPATNNHLSAAYSAIFHSISAFCNAGFSIYSNSFMNYQKNLTVNLVITSLIIIGGLGFIVIANLSRVIISRIKKRKDSLSLHSKLVIFTTFILIGLGTLFLFVGENNTLLKDLPLGEKILTGYFQSITARTAGFNTIYIGSLTTFSSFFLIMLMFVGASPGSTGGGIKTSTFATLLLTIKSMIKGKDQVEIYNRTIPRSFIYQVLCVVTLALGWIGFSTLFLSFTEKSTFLNILFEVFSAFGTVGLSRGLTPQLTNWGKIIIIVTMLAGRVGPLTLALAIAGKKTVKRYEYPEESIIIG